MRNVYLLLTIFVVGCAVNPSVSRQRGIHGIVGYGSLKEISVAVDRDLMAVNQKDETGMTPLHWAVMRALDERKDDPAIVQFLVSKGADPNAKGEFDRTPLHLAAAGGPRIALALIKAGATVDARNAFGQTPLHCAVEHMSEGVVRVLVDNKADVRAKDQDGKTPLTLAAEAHDGAIQALLKQYTKGE